MKVTAKEASLRDYKVAAIQAKKRYLTGGADFRQKMLGEKRRNKLAGKGGRME